MASPGRKMQIEFEALIKKLEIKSLASLDKSGRLLLEFNGEDPEAMDKINRLMRADEMVTITIKNGK